MNDILKDLEKAFQPEKKEEPKPVVVTQNPVNVGLAFFDKIFEKLAKDPEKTRKWMAELDNL